MTLYPFNPDYIIHPGETLREWIDEHNDSIPAFARRAGLPEQDLRNLLAGKAGITDKIARKLEFATGIPERFWIRLQWDYERRKKQYHDF